MTDEEIRKIAREVASLIEPQKGFGGESYWIRLSSEIIEALSQKFCIVEKEKVLEKYALYKMGYTECEGLELGYVMDAMEDIFGSELFNDTEK